MLKVLLATMLSDYQALEPILDGHDVDTLRGTRALLDAVKKQSYDLVIIEGDKELIPAIKAADPRAEVVLLGQDEEYSVEAIRLGASACFPMPVDFARLRSTVGGIDALVEQRREIAALESRLSSKYSFSGIIGRNPQMIEIFNFIRRIAPYYKSALVVGETGSGKELIARALHQSSPAAEEPFVACNCGAMVESLIESELFGHKRGAFTGAVSDKKGLFESAGGGTMFLDEIGEMPLAVQPRLLRVLENGEFRPVGSSQTLKARCRVIAATNRDLGGQVKDGGFREDLYYRIAHFTIGVPPLKDRKDDIPLLSRHFLGEFSERSGKKVLGVSRPAQTALMQYDWPGNVRELQNVLEHAAVMGSESFIKLEDLPPLLREPGAMEAPEGSLILDDAVRGHIQKVLALAGGNRTKAASLMGISRWALLRKLDKFGIK